MKTYGIEFYDELPLAIWMQAKKSEKAVKRVRKMIGRLETKAPKIINPKNLYKRKPKYKKEYLDD